MKGRRIRSKLLIQYYINMQYKYDMLSCYINILLLVYHRCCAMESDCCDNRCFHVWDAIFLLLEIPLYPGKELRHVNN